jgi:hypothetical protein
VCASLIHDARSSKLPLRSSPSVNTFLVPRRNASREIQVKSFGAHTTTAGSASPMKYSISACW